MSRTNKPNYKLNPNHPYFKYRWFLKRGPKSDRKEFNSRYRAQCKDAIRNEREVPQWVRDRGWQHW